MADLGSPVISVLFTELGITAITRGSKGTVAVIVRDAAAVEPVALTQSTQIPTTLGKENQDYITRTFLGYVNPPKKVIVYVTDETDVNLTNALDYMATQDFDYIVGPADCTADEAEAIALWVASQRLNNGTKYKAVLPNYAADKHYIVNFASTGMAKGDIIYTTAEYCSRIAGLLAGTPMKISATYAPLTELTDVDRLTKEELDDAVNAGKLVLKWDGRKAKVNRAVNSFVTTVEGMLDSFKKIKIVEVMDLIQTDITITAEDGYIGKYPNSYDDKLLLLTAIRSYFMGLEGDKLVKSGYTVDIDVEKQSEYLASEGVDTSEMSEQEIREADTGTHVFVIISCKILDAIEDIHIRIEI